MTEELEFIRQGHGKWSESGVPHKGWTCTGVDDLGKGNTRTCDMCGAAEVRFGHRMVHQDYAGELRVGCVCASHMEHDKKLAKIREKEAKLKAKRKSTFSRLKGWKKSKNGNQHIKHSNGCHVLVYKTRYGHWGFKVSYGPNERWGKTYHETIDEAKMAAFELMEDMVRTLPRPRQYGDGDECYEY